VSSQSRVSLQSSANARCLRGPFRLILTYLIPLRLLKGQLPSKALLSRFPRLDELHAPFIRALRAGDIKGYDVALAWAEKRTVEMGVSLSVEKARELCLRGLFRKVSVHLHSNFFAWSSLNVNRSLSSWVVSENKTRLPLAAFHAALQLSGLDVPVEEAECLVANMIFKGYMKGYISHEKQIVVLSKIDPFPKCGTL
jgi:COP9 signalosome complex subunit 12